MLGCCCTTDSVTTQRTAPVPGWVWNTCLEKLWKHLVINGLHLCLCSTCHLTCWAGFVLKSLKFYIFIIILSLLSSVCHRGYFNCTYSPCPAVCTVYSDRHYHTFDGLEYDYHTDCQVYLLKVSSLRLFLIGKANAKY